MKAQGGSTPPLSATRKCILCLVIELLDKHPVEKGYVGLLVLGICRKHMKQLGRQPNGGTPARTRTRAKA